MEEQRSKRNSFNPHTHEGCDIILQTVHYFAVVSIHTPTKGVTTGESLADAVVLVSIHTPTKGVTPKSAVSGLTL